jgi:hypothetical protein
MNIVSASRAIRLSGRPLESQVSTLRQERSDKAASGPNLL